MSAILGVDLGQARIGVAICEAPNLPAVPLMTIEHTSRAKDVERIAKLAEARGARTIVVGYPLKLDGTAGPAARATDKYISELRQAFDGEVVSFDERLTTAAAARKLQDLDVSGSKRRRRIDQLAAVEILNSYVAARRNA